MVAFALLGVVQAFSQDWLREPRLSGTPLLQWGLWFPSAVLMRGPMFRLLDLPAAWRSRSVLPDAALTVGFEVEDSQLPANSGFWTLRLEGGGVAVEKGSALTDLTLRLDIQTLSRLFMGSLPATAAVENGLADADRTGAPTCPSPDGTRSQSASRCAA